MTSLTRCRVPILLFAILGFALRLPAADSTSKYFDLPADAAEKSLRRFSIQSGLQVGFPTDITRGVTSRPIKGEYPPQKALELLLADTGLTAVHDPRTGAFSVRRATQGESKNDQWAARTAVSDRPASRDLPVAMNPLPKS